MKQGAWLLYMALILLLPVRSTGQSCATTSRANTIVPDRLCSPVEVNWDVTFNGVLNAGTTVQIYYNWDDGTSDLLTATEGPAGSFHTITNHTYTSRDDQCNYHPVATLVVNGEMCTSSSQEQIVTIWDTDDENGGRVNAAPNVYPVCVGNGATMRFDDDTRFNCVPPQENDVPNEDTRWIRWVYGTSNTMSSSTPVSVNGYTGPWPYYGPVITLPGPVHGSSEQSLPITVADDNLVGEEFQVELQYWNFCNKYTDGKDPVTDRSVIRIVDLPDPTITPVDTMCEFNAAVDLESADGGGAWSGNGILDTNRGIFAPYVAGPGIHSIRYDITDGNGCYAFDIIEITVRDAPDGYITPVDPFCIYDAPYDLEANPSAGTWSGDGITDGNSGTFDPAVAGIGGHDIVYTTQVDPYGCVGIDSTVVRVADLPFAEFLTPDSAWCAVSNNQSTAEILITGADTSRFDLVVWIRGTLDTLFNLSTDTFTLFLNNQVGHNEYILSKIIEHHGNNSCDNDLYDTLVMEVNDMPVVILDKSDDELCSPGHVNFTASPGYDSYQWDFGEGDLIESSVNVMSHIFEFDYTDNILEIVEGDTIYDLYKTDSLYQIRLLVYTESGCFTEIRDSVRVHLSPIANFFVNPEIQVYPDSVVYLINLTSPGFWSYSWDFGDGSSDTLKEPNQHVFDDWGFYDIELTSFSPYCRDSITKRVQLHPPPPVSLFFPDSVGCPPLEVTFENASNYADTYIWDFDDGTYSTETEPTHVFYQSKEHQVKLVAAGFSGIDTSQRTIKIHERPQALFNHYPADAKNVKQVFKFVNNSINSSYFLWDFGDGYTSPDEEPSHVYGFEGTYTVTLYAWSEFDCPDTLVKESLIKVIAGEGTTEFPNAFVWNGSKPSGGYWTEGTIDNTVFHPNLVNAVELRMIIYNRWGEMIWETNEVYVGWDGYLKSGELASPGVYVYKAWVTYLDGTQELIQGDVTFLH